MSIVLDAIRRAQALHAPKTALLPQALRSSEPRGPWQVLRWRLAGLVALAVVVLAWVALRAGPGGTQPSPEQRAEADIPSMAPVPAAPRTVAAGRAAPVSSSAAAAAAPGAPAASPAPVVAVAAVPKFRPPTRLSE